jgi:hypothetical protein
MSAVSISQFLMLYAWFPLSILLIFLLLIARFYGRTSGERMYFGWFVVPVILFGAATARYSSLNRIAGDSLGDVLFAGAGAFLIVMCVFLYHVMTRDR